MSDSSRSQFETLQDDGTPFQALAFRRLYEAARHAHHSRLNAAYADLIEAAGADEITAAQAEYLDPIFRNRFGNRAQQPGAGHGRPDPTGPRVRAPESHVGSRPRSDGSLQRRRQYLAIGLLPDRYLSDRRWGIYAVLAVVAKAVIEQGRCALFVGQIGAEAGYCESTVQAAIRVAKDSGWISVEYRRKPGALRNDASVITIADPDWLAWLKVRALTWRRLSKRALAFWGMARRGLSGIPGSNLAPATRTRDSEGIAHPRDNTVTRRAKRAEELAGLEGARIVPPRTGRMAPG